MSSNARLSLNRFQRFVIEKIGDSVIIRHAASCASLRAPQQTLSLLDRFVGAGDHRREIVAIYSRPTFAD